MSDHLLVPMHMDAMVLNEEQSIATPFARFSMKYQQLQSFNSAEPRPFSGDTQQPGAGIYLHWTLPDALRHGVEQGDGEVTFPLIPNRWLVVRTLAGANPDKAVKAWLLQSDYMDSTDGSSAYIDPYQLNQYGTPNPTKIGRALRFSADTTSLPSAPEQPFLQAVAPASAWFVMYEPGIQNVLAFYDDMTADDDQTALEQGQLSYYVVGWYADPSSDPLKGLEWQVNPDDATQYTLPAFDWSVYTSADNLPENMLVHAVCPDVPWDADGPTPPPVNYPTNTKDTVKVAIGNTAIDALSAIVRLESDNPIEADMLEAFYYELIHQFDQPGSQEALNMSIREQWYGTSEGGIIWTIVSKEQEDTNLPEAMDVSLSETQKDKLAQLNVTQMESDRQERILESMQWTLAGLWWKYRWQQYKMPPLPNSPDYVNWTGTQLGQHIGVDSGGECDPANCNDPHGTDPSKESWYHCKVWAQQNLLNKLSQQVDQTKAAVGLNDDQEFKANTLPVYYTPNDPVVLVTGLGRSTNYDPVGAVLCRIPAQAINALTINEAFYCAAGSCDHNIQAQIPELADPHQLLPAGIQTLNTENFFLSPELFAQNVLGDINQAAAVESAIEAAAQTKPGLDVNFPPPTYAYLPWQQPWIPLLLEWEVEVLKEPAYTCPEPPKDTSNPINRESCIPNLDHWEFNGSDYVWSGPTTVSGNNFSESDSAQMTFDGRTFVTPQVSFNLAAKLDAFVKNHQFRNPDLEKLLENLDQIVDQLESMDILSQRLSGMMALMEQRNLLSNISPSTDPLVSDLVGSEYQGYPAPFPSKISESSPPPWDFAPLRGTFFVIKKLTVIDNFGRSIDLMLSNYSADPQTSTSVSEYYFYPVAARDLRVSATIPKPPSPDNPAQGSTVERMLQLGPRVIQDSKLNFPLLSNDGSDTKLPLKADANPVCGWVVPNHLDQSFSLYAPDGTAWGELYLSLHYDNGTQQYIPVWQPDPTNPNAPQSLDEIPNSYVKDMFTTLIARQDNGQAFADLLQVIDETLWTINPWSQPSDQELSVLIGRPLVIVRASLNLTLRGLAWRNQDWWNTFKLSSYNQPPPDACQPVDLAAINGDIETPLWPIRLGSQILNNDGLVGYYADNTSGVETTYNTFYAVHLPPDLSTDSYLKHIQPGNYFSLRLVDDSFSTLDPDQNQEQVLTMLVDPRAPVHAFSGISPAAQLDIPDAYISEALANIYYLFRAGPFLTPPDSVQVPPPAERDGTWSWFDHVLDATVGITNEDGKVHFPSTAPLVKEGWLKFQPTPPTLSEPQEKERPEKRSPKKDQPPDEAASKKRKLKPPKGPYRWD